MSQKDINDAVDYLYTHGKLYAEAKAHRVYLEEYRKSQKAMLMKAALADGRADQREPDNQTRATAQARALRGAATQAPRISSRAEKANTGKASSPVSARAALTAIGVSTSLPVVDCAL